MAGTGEVDARPPRANAVLSRVLRGLIRAAHAILGLIALSVAILPWLRHLVRHHGRLRRADVVVAANSPQAFGTLFITIDSVRRLYAGRSIVYLSLLEKAGHNRLLGTALSDIAVLQRRRCVWTMSVLGRSVALPPIQFHDRMAAGITDWYVRWFGKREAVVLTPIEVIGKLPMPASVQQMLPKVEERPPGRPTRRLQPFASYAKASRGPQPGETTVRNQLWYGGWQRLQRAMPAPPMQLPEGVACDVHQRLARKRGAVSVSGRIRLCGFHLRYGGLEDKGHRDGSPLEFYIPAIRFLVESGCQVLVQGDRLFHPQFLSSFDGMVVDAPSLGIDKDVFRLFVGTESDLFIGDWPVAPQVAATNGVPALIVNAWPIGWGLNDTWVDYRGLVDDNGRLYPYDRMLALGPLLNCNSVVERFEELLEASPLRRELEAARPLPLSEAEILDSVKCFLDHLDRGEPNDPHAEVGRLLPSWTPFRLSRPTAVCRQAGCNATYRRTSPVRRIDWDAVQVRQIGHGAGPSAGLWGGLRRVAEASPGYRPRW